MNTWPECATNGWIASESGDIEAAYREYEKADEIMADGGYNCRMNPELQLLRHRVGTATGTLNPYPPNEEQVVSIQWCTGATEADSADGMHLTEINADNMKAAISYIAGGDAGFHRENISQDLSHIQVLSTGRVGSVGLFRLLERSQHVPYHSFFYQVPVEMRYQAVCQLSLGVMDASTPWGFWLKTRAAEWLSAINQGKTMVGLNHLDTVFAPVFAAVHPLARFVTLRRDPVKVFESLFSKNQWSATQVCPLYYSFSPFKYRSTGWDVPVQIAWYIRFTEVFCEAMRETLPGKVRMLDADKLFLQDHQESEYLRDIFELDMSVAEIQRHYAIPINAKRHKATMDEIQLAPAREQFIDAYKQFGGEL